MTAKEAKCRSLIARTFARSPADPPSIAQCIAGKAALSIGASVDCLGRSGNPRRRRTGDLKTDESSPPSTTSSIAKVANVPEKCSSSRCPATSASTPCAPLRAERLECGSALVRRSTSANRPATICRPCSTSCVRRTRLSAAISARATSACRCATRVAEKSSTASATIV